MTTVSVSYPIITLEDSEMFRNSKNEVCSVEVRGVRTWNGCYFKAIDIGRVFGNDRLSHDITKKTTKYEEGKDYIKIAPGGNIPLAQSPIYFTYMGLARWLMRSYNPETQHYMEWMMRTLFTVQFGTEEAREELAEEITCPDYVMFKSFSHICVHKIAGVYLFKVKVIDSKYSVYKFGRSEDIGRRFGEHARKYGVDNVELTQFASIPEKMLVDAERCIKNMTIKFKYVDGKHKEHLKLAKYHMEQIRLVFEIVHNKFEVQQEDDVVSLRQEVEETKRIAIRDYDTTTELFTNQLESLQQEIEDGKQRERAIIRDYEAKMASLVTEHETKMTIMRNGFRLQMTKLKEEARVFMDNMKGVMDMFF